MPTCATCGASLTGKEAFCTFCGMKIVRASIIDEADPATIDPYAATSKRADEIADSIVKSQGRANTGSVSADGTPIDPMARTVAKDPEMTEKPIQPVPGISRVSPLASSHFDFESAKQGNAKTEAQPAYPTEIKGTAMMPSRPMPSSGPFTQAPGTPPPRTPASSPPSPVLSREASVPPRAMSSSAPRPFSSPPAPFDAAAPIPPPRAPFGSDPHSHTPAFQPGARVLVLWANGQRYPGSIVAIAPGRYCVTFGNGQQIWAESQYVFPAP